MSDSIERLETNLRRGVLEFCVLALLSREERYGLDLATDLIERRLIASEGSLYPLLSRMRESGLVEARWQPSGAGRPRRYYAITALGSDQLASFIGVWKSIGGQVDQLLEGIR